MTAQVFKVLIALLVLVLLLAALVAATAATRVCLTKQQARHLWPKQHIYWYSKDHCWSDRRGRPRNLKFEPVRKRNIEPNGSIAPGFRANASYNEIDAHADDPPPLVDVDEAHPFAVWEERIGGQFVGAISK